MNFVKSNLLCIVLLAQLTQVDLQTSEDYGKQLKSSIAVRNGIAFLTTGKIRFEKQEVKLRRVIDFTALSKDLQLLAEAIEILNDACSKSLIPGNKFREGVKATLDLWESPAHGWSTRDRLRYTDLRKSLFATELPLQLNCATFVGKWENRKADVQRRINRALIPLQGRNSDEGASSLGYDRQRRALPLVMISAFVNAYHQYKLRRSVKANTYSIEELRVRAAAQDQILANLRDQTRALDTIVKDQQSLRSLMTEDIAALYEKTDKMTIFLAGQVQLINLFNRFEEYLQKIELEINHKIEALQLVIFASANHRTSQLVFTPMIYKELKAELPQFTFLRPISELRSEVDLVTQNSFRLTTTIPAYEKDVFLLYRILAIPDLASGFVPEIPTPLIAMRSRGSAFIPLTELQLSLCQKSGCRAPAKETATTFAPCGVAQIVGQPINNCAWRPYVNKHYITKFPRGFVFRFKTNATATVQCDDGALTNFVLTDAGVLELPPGCKATVHHKGLQSHIDGPTKIVEARRMGQQVMLLNTTFAKVAKVVKLRGLAKYSNPWKISHILSIITVITGVIVLILVIVAAVVLYAGYIHFRANRASSKIRRVRGQMNQMFDPHLGFTEQAAERMIALLNRLLQQPHIMRLYPDLARTAIPQTVELQARHGFDPTRLANYDVPPAALPRNAPGPTQSQRHSYETALPPAPDFNA
ncbi:MAG: hypothetical protein GXO35_08520 [Gammaproteobacteria bacterium]|jgi:hypothetical protein|nr:hypothetical protein [Gammaproteobacteria bacterium]